MNDTEINEAIHEKVMGECWHEWKSNSTGDRYACLKRKCFGISLYGTPDEPDYCKDIAAAWVVVEKLRQRWFELDPHETFFFQFTDCAQHGWRVDVMHGHHDGDGEVLSTSAPTLPRAICFAALVWVGQKL